LWKFSKDLEREKYNWGGRKTRDDAGAQRRLVRGECSPGGEERAGTSISKILRGESDGERPKAFIHV